MLLLPYLYLLWGIGIKVETCGISRSVRAAGLLCNPFQSAISVVVVAVARAAVLSSRARSDSGSSRPCVQLLRCWCWWWARGPAWAAR